MARRKYHGGAIAIGKERDWPIGDTGRGFRIFFDQSLKERNEFFPVAGLGILVGVERDCVQEQLCPLLWAKRWAGGKPKPLVQRRRMAPYQGLQVLIDPFRGFPVVSRLLPYPDFVFGFPSQGVHGDGEINLKLLEKLRDGRLQVLFRYRRRRFEDDG